MNAMPHPKPSPRPDPTPPCPGFVSMTEARALRAIVDAADMLIVDGRRFLLVRVDDDTLDTLATLDSEREDIEPEEDCCEARDDEVESGPAFGPNGGWFCGPGSEEDAEPGEYEEHVVDLWFVEKYRATEATL